MFKFLHLHFTLASCFLLLTRSSFSHKGFKKLGLNSANSGSLRRQENLKMPGGKRVNFFIWEKKEKMSILGRFFVPSLISLPKVDWLHFCCSSSFIWILYTSIGPLFVSDCSTEDIGFYIRNMSSLLFEFCSHKNHELHCLVSLWQ